jgi:adenosylcobinamide-GDP ribazoletransferase
VALGGLFWPAWLAVPLALVLEARLTGAFHEDALADFCDAFGGGWTREQTFEILKDSRIGSYGAVALILGIVLRAGAMTVLASEHGIWTWGAAIVAAATASRWIAVLAMVCVAPVSHRESLARDIGSRLGRRDLMIASLWGLPGVLPFVITSPLHAAASCVVVVPLVWWLLKGIERRLGGITGDCLGFLTFVSQVVILLVAAANVDFWKALS